MDDLLEMLMAFGVRETLVVLVVLVAIYMLVVVLRMKSLPGQRRATELSSARYEDDLAKRRVEVDRFYAADLRAEPPPAPAPVVPPPTQESARASVASIDQEKIHRLERELAATRDELDALRTAFSEVRDELRAEVDRLKAAQRVSPVYADSMQMALAGASAEAIAARCGISRAEADLVLVLAKGGSDAPDARSADAARERYGSY